MTFNWMKEENIIAKCFRWQFAEILVKNKYWTLLSYFKTFKNRDHFVLNAKLLEGTWLSFGSVFSVNIPVRIIKSFYL